MSEAEDVASLVSLRPAMPGDAAFVFDSWLESYRDNNSEAKAIPWPLYRSMQRLCIEKLLTRPDTRVLVACASESPAQILGWVAVGQSAAQGVLHYLYIKALYRGFDITSVLTAPIAKGCRWYSHRTPKLQRTALKLGLTFNPYLAGVLL